MFDKHPSSNEIMLLFPLRSCQDKGQGPKPECVAMESSRKDLIQAQGVDCGHRLLLQE